MSALSQQELDVINQGLPPALRRLHARIVHLQSEPPEAQVEYTPTKDFCHSEIVVQGGFLTGMLDACMAQLCFAVFGKDRLLAVPTLEIKVSFISPGNPGTMLATARPQHFGKSTAFLEASLVQIEDGGKERLVATATSTVKLVLKREA